MKDLRAIGHFGGWLVALVALGTGACGGGSPAAKPDTGAQDAPADMQQATDVLPGTDLAPDGGVDDAAVTDDAADGPVDAGSGIDCAPVPTGGRSPRVPRRNRPPDRRWRRRPRGRSCRPPSPTVNTRSGRRWRGAT